MVSNFALAVSHVGFFGQTGPLWAFLGFVCVCIVIAILFKIVKLVLPALGVTEPWVSVIYWLAVLFIFIWFVGYALGFNWWN